MFFLKNSLEETNLSMVFRRIRENVVFRTRMEGTKTEGGIVSQFMPLLCPSSQSNITFETVGRSSYRSTKLFFPPCHQQSLFRSFSQTTMSVTNKISCCILSLPLWEEMKKMML